VVVGLWVCWRYRRRWGRGWLLGLGHFVVMLLPVLGFFNIYFMRYSLVADHWQYFSILGPIALAVAGINTALGRFEQRGPFLKPALCGVLLLTLGVLTWRQCGMYADSETLWQTTIGQNPNSFMAHNNLGNVFLQQGRADDAIAQFQKAREIQPDQANAYYNLGNALLQKGRLDEAVVQFQTALKIEPGYAKAHNNLANTLLQQGRVDEAIAHFQTALNIQPDFAEAHNNLGNALLRKGQLDAAIGPLPKGLGNPA